MKNDPVQIGLIVASSENGVIGVDGDLPWSLPDDLKHFMRSTKDHAVVMGRKTFESLEKPLGSRLNIVVSRSMDQENAIEGSVSIARTLDEAIEFAQHVDQQQDGYQRGLIWIAGGGEIYCQAIGRADRIVRTLVHCEIEGDAYFPELNPEEWLLDRSERHEVDDRHGFAFTIEWWRRR
ncbi:MAG: dihydrofolate reductase [Phycisphaerales bacterium]|nr:dihydrofolate reductase [Phycisphaerales bacterium]